MQYLAAIRSLERQFKGFTLQHVDRAKNEEADALAKAATRGESLPSDVFFHVIGTPAVRSPEGLQITNDTEGHLIVNLIIIESCPQRAIAFGPIDELRARYGANAASTGLPDPALTKPNLVVGLS